MTDFEVPEAIICSPFEEPTHYWRLEEGAEPEKRPGRRPAIYYYPEPSSENAAGTTVPKATAIELKLVSLIRSRVKEWRAAGYPGVTATTLELLNYWRRDGRSFRFFFAQLEAAETIIFLNETRRDLAQGIDIPLDEPSEQQKAERGYKAFRRYACKMATGSGKTTVMGMLAAWSILNKVHDRSNARYSDVVLVVCPNVTIRSRLAELDPRLGDANLYRKADLVPPHLMPDLTQGHVLITNWHVFEPQTSQAGGVSGRVVKAGRRETVPEIIYIGPKTTTARGRRYLTSEEYSRQVSLGLIEVIDEEKDSDGNVKYARVTRDRYVESDTALVSRILGREVGGKQNILVLNDEAHHAYWLGGLWEELRAVWSDIGCGQECTDMGSVLKDAAGNDPRPPVFIVVCKNTAIAKVVYEWLAENKPPMGIPPSKIAGFRNADGRLNTIRVDSRVVSETDTGHAKSDEVQWMRFTLDTVGRTDWPRDRQGRPIYPEGFEELATKRGRPLHPPGRGIRCIVSVGMLTEGWDCNTVTHIVGLRPFMSQLLCEQVVGRGLRWRTYELGDSGLMTEEVAKVFGVPFQVIPFKANPAAAPKPTEKRHHVRALPGRAHFEITFPRVEGYRQAIRNRVTVDWASVPPLFLDPFKIPPEVEVKASLQTNTCRSSLTGPGAIQRVDLNPFRSGRRIQELVFKMAGDLTREYVNTGSCEAPAHVLFPQLVTIVQRYIQEKVTPIKPAERLDLFLSPYYGWAIERLVESIRPDTSQGEAPEVPRYETSRGPGSASDVDYWTSKDVREVVKSHVNHVVADTSKWEQQAAYIIDTLPSVEAFVKNAGLGFAIPYIHNGQAHDYVPDFIVRLRTDPHTRLIVETKGFDDLAEVKTAAAHRWVAAVNADGRTGTWHYVVARKVDEVRRALDGFCAPSKAVETAP